MTIKLNIHLYPSSLKYSSRIMKEATSLAKAKIYNNIYVVGVWREGLKEHEIIGEHITILRVKLWSNCRRGLLCKLVTYLEWQMRIYLMFRTSAKVINCHSLSVLPLGWLFKRFSRAQLVYDTHELETETVGNKGLRKKLAKFFEKRLIYSTDLIITVNDSIKKWYQETYGLNNVYAVRNIPYNNQALRNIYENQDLILKRKFGIKENELLFIYQGLLSYGRGIEILLDVFAQVDSHKHVVFMGKGELENKIKKHENLYPNIHFQSIVPPNEVLKYTSSADVGISLGENVCLSYYLSLPNKLFEYIMSGIPVIASDFPEMKRVVIDEGQCGWVIPVNRERLYSLVQELTIDDVIEKRNHALFYRETIGWHHEEQVMINAYREMMGN